MEWQAQLGWHAMAHAPCPCHAFSLFCPFGAWQAGMALGQQAGEGGTPALGRQACLFSTGGCLVEFW